MPKTRDHILLYINGERVVVRGADAFLMLSDYLRVRRRLTGTKIVCAEGDCGACTVMRSAPPAPVARGVGARGAPPFRMMNSCITPVALLDCANLVTIEGLREDGALNELQRSMVAHQGGQCGFCTPGIVMALSALFEKGEEVSEKDVKNHLTGNLCRCTGYLPILEAALAVDRSKLRKLSDRYGGPKVDRELLAALSQPVAIEVPASAEADGRRFFAPTRASEISKLLREHEGARLLGAATDLGVWVNKGKLSPSVWVSARGVAGLDRVQKIGRRGARVLRVGSRVTISELERAVEREVPELARFLRVFASPQIKNAATLAGNVANGSPIGDALPFLLVAEAVVEARGSRKRRIPFAQFYRGYRRTDLRPGEWIEAISFAIPGAAERLRLLKVAQRKDLDISCVNAGFRMALERGVVRSARIAFGGVGPTVLSLPETEAFLKGKPIDPLTVEKALSVLASEIKPRSDVRGTGSYRVKLSQNLLKRALLELAGEIPPC